MLDCILICCLDRYFLFVAVPAHVWVLCLGETARHWSNKDSVPGSAHIAIVNNTKEKGRTRRAGKRINLAHTEVQRYRLAHLAANNPTFRHIKICMHVLWDHQTRGEISTDSLNIIFPVMKFTNHLWFFCCELQQPPHSFCGKERGPAEQQEGWLCCKLPVTLSLFSVHDEKVSHQLQRGKKMVTFEDPC